MKIADLKAFRSAIFTINRYGMELNKYNGVPTSNRIICGVPSLKGLRTTVLGFECNLYLSV